jgi:hypothetical protein
LRDNLAGEPLVARILEVFPGAKIDEVKTPDLTDGTQMPDADFGDNNEEMSG